MDQAASSRRDTIIVTGSSGLIGSALVRKLAQGFSVICCDVEIGHTFPPDIETERMELTSDESVMRALERIRERHGNEIASVVHLAAYYDFSAAPSQKYGEITVEGTRRLLRLLRGFDVRQFIFSSTMLVHAPCVPGERINEQWPIDPGWPYPESKVKTEAVLRAERGDIPIVVLRIAGVYDEMCHSIPLAQQMRRIYERSFTSRFFPGDLSHGQSFVHLSDLIDAIGSSIAVRAALPEETTLLIGEEDVVSYGQLQREFGRLIHGEPWRTWRIPRVVAKAGAWLQDAIPFAPAPFIKPWMIDRADDHYALDTGAARDALGWQPRHRLRDTLPSMVDTLLADPAGWYRANKLDPPTRLDSSGANRPQESAR